MEITYRSLFVESILSNKLSMIIETLEEIMSTLPRNDRIKFIREQTEKLSTIIIKGFKTILEYLTEKWPDVSEENSQLYELENHRLRINSAEGESNDQEKWLGDPPEMNLGFVIPIRCGHRGYPKEKDKEKKAFDSFLHSNGFTSRSKCDQDSNQNNHVSE